MVDCLRDATAQQFPKLFDSPSLQSVSIYPQYAVTVQAFKAQQSEGETMSRKHYIALARLLWAARPSKIDAAGQAQWHADIDAVADACQQFNPAFDRARFIAACEEGGAK